MCLTKLGLAEVLYKYVLNICLDVSAIAILENPLLLFQLTSFLSQMFLLLSFAVLRH